MNLIQNNKIIFENDNIFLKLYKKCFDSIKETNSWLNEKNILDAFTQFPEIVTKHLKMAIQQLPAKHISPDPLINSLKSNISHIEIPLESAIKTMRQARYLILENHEQSFKELEKDFKELKEKLGI